MVTNSVLIFLKNVEKILQKYKNTIMGGLEVASQPSIQVVQWLVQWLAVVYYDDVYFIMQQYYRICLIIFYCSHSPLSTIQH